MPEVNFRGRIAYHPVIRTAPGPEPAPAVGGDRPYGLGVVEEYGAAGYRPYRGPAFADREAAQAAADEMNARLGLTPREAALIVATNIGNDVNLRRRGRRS